MKIVDEHCRKSGKEFNNLDEKLRYCAMVMSESWSEGKKYDISAGSNIVRLS
jgi:hypothetical protein